MSEIWKFPLRITDRQTVSMPANANVLTAQFQRGILCLWALIDPTVPLQSYQVWIVGTGHQFPESLYLAHIATVQENDNLVWHVFMAKRS